MLKKITVCYLFTKFDNEQTLLNFIDNYKKYNSNYPHNLVICFKLLDVIFINNLRIHLNGINYVEFIDKSSQNDFDFGSYKRVSEKYPDDIILFLNSHSYPNCDLWLSKIVNLYKEKSIIGTSASNESLLNSLKLKKFYKFFGYSLKKYKYQKDFFKFPNPHLRTTGFLINATDFHNYIKDKKLNSKYDAWLIESGKNNLTTYFKKKNYNIVVVNSDGNHYLENNWMLSETYNYLNQSKSIISDRHTRKYLGLSDKNKRISQFNTWGI